MTPTEEKLARELAAAGRLKTFCWRCHVECTPQLYCPSCGTGHGPFYNAEQPHAHGTPIPLEPRVGGEPT